MSRDPERTSLILSALVALSLTAIAPPARAFVQTVDGTWSSLDTTVAAPSARREYAAVYDELNDRYVLFGGNGPESLGPEQLYNEVWALTLGSPQAWSLLEVAGNPPGPRKGVQWGYDAARHRMLVFGGYGQHHPGDPIAYLNDVWQLSLEGTPTWTELLPSGTPPAGRLAGASVYDPLRQRFVGFGGTAGLPVDTWSLELSGDPAWTTIDTGAQSPPGSYGMATIYDPVRDRMLIFGGSLTDAYFGTQNKIWELTLSGTPAWSPVAVLDTTNAPAPRRSLGAVYDAMRDRMVIFGGWDGLGDESPSFLGDTWALSLAGTPAWQALAPTGPLPTGRDVTTPIYDPLRDRLVTYGGWSSTVMLGDTEFLTWGDAPPAATMTATATAVSNAASLRWNVQHATGAHAAVYRTGPGQPWSSIATVTSDAGGTVTFVDHAVVAGATYSYQIAIATHRGASFGGQVTVPIPTTGVVTPPLGVTFALDRVRPNPVVDRFDVSFALPNDEPASVELVDVTGRRLASREVGSLGAGTHAVELGSAREYAPGIYFVRLTRAGETLTRRAVVAGGAR